VPIVSIDPPLFHNQEGQVNWFWQSLPNF